MKNKNISDKDLVEKLHKQIIREFKERKVHSPVIDNIQGADLADMRLIIKFNKGVCFYYVQLTFIANIHGLFLLKVKKVLQLLMLSKNS